MAVELSKKSFDTLRSLIKGSAATAVEKEAMLEEVESGNPLNWDKWVYRTVVISLGLAVIACLAFVFVISYRNATLTSRVEIHEIFLALGSAAVGALAGLLAPSPGGGSGG